MPDSQNNQTIIPLTPQLLPIIAEVMAVPSGPDQQINDETRGKLTELVRYVATKSSGEVRKYEVLAALL